MNGIDATIIIAYLLAMVGVGVGFMRRNKSADDYFRGGGRLPWWVVSLSIYATLFSSITFLSIPALTYHTDCRYFFKTFGILVLAPIVVKFYLPFFRKLNLTSAYEYLEVRFNLGCRLFASTAFILFMIARTAVVAYLPSVAIAAVTGIDVNLAIVIVTLITIAYCTIGGVEAVVWSDFVQSVILIGSTIAIYIYLVCGTDGGLSGFITKGMDAGKFKMMDFGWDWAQPVLWVAVVGGIVENLASYTSDQCVVQRYMTCKDEVSAAKSIKLNGLLSFVNCLVFFTLGVALWTFYQSHADKIPVLAKQDQIFPWFIAHELPVGFSGLVLAAVAAATMSTLSANLNSAATAITTDFYKRLRSKVEVDDGRVLRCGKISTVIIGLLGGALALVLANMEIGSIYDVFLKALGVLTGGLACLFLMGRFMPFVDGRGAFMGLVANYAVCFSLDLVPFAHKPHLLLYGFFGMIACLVVAPIASLASKRAVQGLVLVAFLVAGGGVTAEPWFVFNEDFGNYCYSCGYAKKTPLDGDPRGKELGRFPFGRDGLVKYIDELAQGKVTHFTMCVNTQRPCFDSKTIEPIWSAWNSPDRDCDALVETQKALVDWGIDRFAVWIDRCREKGVSPWVSVRMNDMHVAHDPRCGYISTFWRQHPEFHRYSDEEAKKKGVWYWEAHTLDYSHPEVRNRMLAFLDEVLERYDADGLDLDFTRFPWFLSPGKERAQASLMTDFLREVRKKVDAASARRGHKVLLAVRTVSSPDAAEASGLDIGTWGRERLIDVLSACNHYSCIDLRIPVADWRRRLGPGVHLVVGADFGLFVNGARHNLTREEYLGWADVMQAQGVSDFYFYNLFGQGYTSEIWRQGLTEGFGPEVVATHARTYPLTFRDFSYAGVHETSVFPWPVKLEKPFSNVLPVGTVPAGSRASLLLGFKEKPSAVPVPVVNGKSVTSSSRTFAREGVPFGLAWPLDAKDVCSGANRITLPVCAGVEIVYAALRIEPDAK